MPAAHRPAAMLLTLAGLLAGCSSEPVPECTLGKTGEPIIGGIAADAPALDAVGSLVMAYPVTGASPVYGSPFCTATLVGPRAVLTAKHCAEAVGDFQDFGFAIGSDGSHPKRVVPVVAQEVESTVTGGFIAKGSDVAVLHLGEAVTDVAPVAIGELAAADVGHRFGVVGYGEQDIQGTSGTRHAGSVTLRGTSGRVFELAFGGFDAFKSAVKDIADLSWQVGDVSTPDGEQRARAIYDSERLLDGYEVFVGGAAGDAQPCHGDSGGPLMRTVNGKRTTYGVTSWGHHRVGSFCDYGGTYAVFGPATQTFLKKALAWVDPCEGVTTNGRCDGAVATRCAARKEGVRRRLVTDCGALGLACRAGGDGQVACVGN